MRITSKTNKLMGNGHLHLASQIPFVEGERLLLRTHSMEDWQTCCEIWGNAEVARFTGGKTQNSEEVWRRLLLFQGAWVSLGYGYWLIEEKESAKIIGAVGFCDFKRNGLSDIHGEAELGYALHPESWGKGYATEACELALDWFIQHHSSKNIVCIISSPNHASINVANKLGFTHRRSCTYNGEASEIFERVHCEE